jgi:hypothetical protein
MDPGLNVEGAEVGQYNGGGMIRFRCYSKGRFSENGTFFA